MRNHNSQNSAFYAELLVSIHHDMVGAMYPQSEVDRDSVEIRKRSRHEGLSFLTKALPALGKSIDVSLATGSPLKFDGFKTAAGTALPAFMLGAFRRVFRDDGVPWFATWYFDLLRRFHRNEAGQVDNPYGLRESEQLDDETATQLWPIAEKRFGATVPEWHQGTFPGLHTLDEVLLSHNETEAISLGVMPVRTIPNDQKVVLSLHREVMAVALKSLRQVCYAFYKLNIPYTNEQESKVLEDFVATDSGLDFSSQALRPEDQHILKSARRLICRVLSNADPLAGRPRHGPGAVATGEKSPQKHTFRRYYKALNAFFPYDDWFFYNCSHLCDSFQELQAMEELEAGTAKVVLVPKDSRGPRLISCEPLEYQWIQQALMSVLVDTIEQHPLTRGLVNFRWQDPNRDGALEGSSAPFRRVTLDMKEASDRVSLELVKELFPERWVQALDASRSPDTRLPNGTVVHMKKFAPMGSAVCFPVEALIFWALCTAAIEKEIQDQTWDHPSATLTRSGVKPEANVLVYGDDIICDVDYHDVIINTLPKFGLMLNERKCCTAGPFKESCGMDAFFGIPVTPTKIRSVWCNAPESGSLASYVAYANAFYRDGLLETARSIRIMIQDLLRDHGMHDIPTINSGEPSVLAFVRPDVDVRLHNSPRNLRYNRRFQRMEVRSYTCCPKSQSTSDYGWNLLTRLHASVETTVDPETLLGVPRAITTSPTGHYPIVHRNKLMRTWTPLR